MRPGSPGFIGERLREAREARMMTAVTLAETAGVTSAAISQYEHGRQSPAPEVLRRICTALNVPMHRFTRPLVERQQGTLFYRCMAAATKKSRLRAERRYGWLHEICDFVGEFVKLPTVRVPQFELPKDPAEISSDRIEEIATEARRFWGLRDGPISNVVWLLENHGVIVSRTALDAETLDAFSEWALPSGRPFVVLSSDKNSAVRSRFDAAHELGHLLLHRNVRPESLSRRDNFALIERQAHQFASAFLMPATSFREAVFSASLEALLVVKQQWLVSVGAMVKRMADLRMITSETEKRLWLNMGRRGWRKCEPLDDKLEVERPRFLQRSIGLLIEKRLVAAHDLPVNLALPSTDIEQLAGLECGMLGGADLSVQLKGDPEVVEDDVDIDAVLLRFPSAHGVG